MNTSGPKECKKIFSAQIILEVIEQVIKKVITKLSSHNDCKTTAKSQLCRKIGIENESGVKFLSVSIEKSQWIPERACESGLASEG